MAGIAIPAPQKYYEYLMQNVYNLCVNIKYTHPIEIWEVGDELTNEMRESLSLFQNIIFKNTTEFDDRIQHWRGFQAKAPVIKHSKLNDIIICDADVVIFEDPSIIQKSEPYIETGSYIFRDYAYWCFDLPSERLPDQINISKFNSHNYYDKRRSFIRSIAPIFTPLFPQEWMHLYNDSYPNYPVPESLAESGVFFINREKNNDVINTFYDLNNNWKESYEYVHGDKELTWLSFIKNNKKCTLNNFYPTSYNNKLLQLYNNKPFYIQKY
jgi:hypothetical protein